MSKTFSSPDPLLHREEDTFTVEFARWHERTTTQDHEEGGEPQTHVERYTERDSASFRVRPDVSGTLVMQIDLVGSRGAHGRGSEAILEFIDAALVPDEVAAWNKLIADPDVHIHVETINEVAGWLYRLYTANPTQRL